MTFILWILIIFNATLLLALITFGIMFVIRRRTTLFVILPDKTFETKSFYGRVNKTMKVGNGQYIIDDTCMIRGFWGFKLYYFFGNPNPINFDFTRNLSHEIGTKSQDLKSFHESDLITKLFATENLEQLILYLVIGSCLLSVVTLIVIFTKGQPQVTLANNANNTQMIINAVKIAIKGGV